MGIDNVCYRQVNGRQPRRAPAFEGQRPPPPVKEIPMGQPKTTPTRTTEEIAAEALIRLFNRVQAKAPQYRSRHINTLTGQMAEACDELRREARAHGNVYSIRSRLALDVIDAQRAEVARVYDAISASLADQQAHGRA